MENRSKSNLGERIIELRKNKGITQQQLADMVGVSAPAVSKWETNVSYPDITLLCPVARVLGVSVDQLLQFETTLTKQEIETSINEIITCSRKEGIFLAEKKLIELLHTYPTDLNLKYHVAITYMFFRMQHPKEETEENIRWKKVYVKLLEEVKDAGNTKSNYYEKAVSSLASAALAEDELDKAESLLQELSSESSEHAILWSQYYVKRGDTKKALEVTQKRLYTMVRKMQMSLISMMNEHIIKDPKQMLEICKIYRQVEQIFLVGGETSEGFFIEAYKRMGEYEQAKEHTISMIHQLLGTIQMPNPILFAPNVVVKLGEPVANVEMKKMLYDGIQKEEFLKEFQEDEALQNAMRQLKENIAMER